MDTTLELTLLEPDNVDREYARAHRRVQQAVTESLGIPTLWPGEYKNPFDFTTEHDQWFEFLRRKYFGKELTFDIIRDMLPNDRRRAAGCLETNFSSIHCDAKHFAERTVSDRRMFFGSGC